MRNTTLLVLIVYLHISERQVSVLVLLISDIGGAETSGSTFGFGIGAGMDYYVYENVYMGLELGLWIGKQVL